MFIKEQFNIFGNVLIGFLVNKKYDLGHSGLQSECSLNVFSKISNHSFCLSLNIGSTLLLYVLSSGLAVKENIQRNTLLSITVRNVCSLVCLIVGPGLQ